MIATATSSHASVVQGLLEGEQPAGACFNTLVRYASHQQAGDVFCSAERDGCRLAIRTDGMVRDLGLVPRAWGTRLTAYAKVEAKLDAAEHRRPQDGRIMVWDGTAPIDVRVSLLPTFFGEDLALRVLDRRNQHFGLEKLGLSSRARGEIASLIRQPHGLVLVSGSTGSGKTTTLYSILTTLNDGRRKLNTLEDPIEFDLPGVHQSQINPMIGLDFCELLPAVLRQDPDIIMVGEVRDPETATTAVRAAVTGQLVFATLHATCAAGAIHGMLGLGAHPHLLSGSLRGVVAQHLLRRICAECSEPLAATATLATFEDVQHLLEPGATPMLHQGRGCDACFMSGYRHRAALFEILMCRAEIQALICQSASPADIEEQALRDGMIPLRVSAKLGVANAVTTLEEAMRVIDLQN